MPGVDSRGVVERAEDVVLTADIEERTGLVFRRCVCGATALKMDAFGRRCAGCGSPAPSLLDGLHPAPVAHPIGGPVVVVGEWERGVSPETSAEFATSSVRKGADAPVGGAFAARVAALSAAVARRLAPTISRVIRRDPDCGWCGEDGHSAAECPDTFGGVR